MYKIVLIGLVVVIASVGATMVIFRHPAALPVAPVATTTAATPVVAATSTTYTNATYGYAVTYPIDLQRQEYPNGSIALGRAGTSSFTVLANVRVAASGASSTYSDFESFVIADNRNQCAADGPTGSIRCTKVLDINPYTNAQGLSGLSFSLDRVHDVFATSSHKIATTTHDVFGPFYVFNIGANNASSAATYTALVVQPSPSLAADQLDAALVTHVADSAVINKVGP